MIPQIYKIDVRLPDNLVEHMDEIAEFEDSMVIRDKTDVASADQRKSKVFFFSTSDWVAGFAMKHVLRINEHIWRYDLQGVENNGLQYSNYHVGDHYTWHVDTTGAEIDRKLSFSLVLNDDYEGGEFQAAKFKFGDEISAEYTTVPSNTGSLIVFPSVTPHRVLPVTKGVRKSIVGWFIGRPWR